jgi:hypothetical protein
VSLDSITSLLRIRREKENGQTKRQEQKKNTIDPLTSPNALELIWGLRVDWLLWLSWSVGLFLLQWMKILDGLDGSEWGGWGVFIASQPLLVVGWFLLVMGALDSHYALSGARHISTTVRVWSSWPFERLVVLLHPTVWCPLTSALWLLHLHCSPQSAFCSRPLAPINRCSAGSPDSSVNYSGGCPRISKEWLVWRAPGWRTGHCPVHHFLAYSKSCSIFNCVPNLISFLVCVELYAPVIDEL